MKTFGMIIPAIIIAAAMVIVSAAILAPTNETEAAGPYWYLDVYGDPASTGGATVVEIPNAGLFPGLPPYYELNGLSNEWYILTNNIDLGPDSELWIKHTVNLIIGANCTMTLDKSVYLDTGAILYLWSEFPGSGDIGKLVSRYSSAINTHDGVSVFNTAYARGDYFGIFSDRETVVYNGVTGIIEGGGAGVASVAAGEVFNYGSIAGTNTDACGVAYSGFGKVCNYGEIKGTGLNPGIFLENGGSVYNYERSTIKGGFYGVKIEGNYSSNSIYNVGSIEGHTYGAFVEYSASIKTEAGSTIKAQAGLSIRNFNGTVHQFLNKGTIEGTSSNGIVIEDGNCNTHAITNDGVIKGASTAVFIPAGTNMKVVNNGLITSTWSDGVFFGTAASNSTLTNNAGDGTATGLISSCEWLSSGVNFAAGGTLYNHGKISGGDNGGVKANAPVTIYNYSGNGTTTGLITGTGYGVYINTGRVDNYGVITGTGLDSFGIWATNASIYNNGNGTTSGVISGVTDGVVQSDFSFDPPHVFINEGLIKGGQHGVYIRDGFFVSIVNKATGEIRGTDASGVGIYVIDAENSVYIKNEGGIIFGQATGIYLEVCGTVMNEFDGTSIGSITGTDAAAVNLQHGGRVYNEGTITGGDYGIYSLDDTEVGNYNYGTPSPLKGVIKSTNNWAVYIGGGALVSNVDGSISGAKGVHAGWLDKESDQYIVNTGSIVATSGYGIFVDDGQEVEITNSGVIESVSDEFGVWVDHGDTIYIENTAAGTVKTLIYAPIGVWTADTSVYIINSGTIEAHYGIEVYRCDDILIINDGTITNTWTGIYSQRYVTVVNNGTISAGSPWNGWGLSLPNGGNVTNYGEITSTVNSIFVENGSITLVNRGLIKGKVNLTDDANSVTFGAGSKIDGDFSIGSNPESTLRFEGILDPPLKYAEITGATDIGDKIIFVTFDAAGAGLPPGFAIGDKIVLIDGSAGSIVTAPANSSFEDDGKFFKIYIKNRQLIAEFAILESPVKNYYITASSDGNTAISPAGKVTVEGGSSATFTFTAVAGSFVGSVAVDGVYLSQADIDKGHYTFFDVKSNHTIKVESRGAKMGISLTVTVAEGKGYAEYSVNGGPFAKYSSAVPIPEGSNVTLRAVAEKGFEFVEWKEGGVITPAAEVAFNNVSSNLDVSVSFSGEDSSGISSNNLLLYAVIAIVILLAAVVLAFLLMRPKAA